MLIPGCLDFIEVTAIQSASQLLQSVLDGILQKLVEILNYVFLDSSLIGASLQKTPQLDQ